MRRLLSASLAAAAAIFDREGTGQPENDMSWYDISFRLACPPMATPSATPLSLLYATLLVRVDTHRKRQDALAGQRPLRGIWDQSMRPVLAASWARRISPAITAQMAGGWSASHSITLTS